MDKDEEKLFFSNVVTIISILLAVVLFAASLTLQANTTVNPSQQTQVYLIFHLKLATMEYIGIVVGSLILLSIFRLSFSSERLLKRHKWFKKNQMRCYIALDVLLICLLVLTFYILYIYAT